MNKNLKVEKMEDLSDKEKIEYIEWEQTMLERHKQFLRFTLLRETANENN
jgi:hypothetical protein